MTIESGAPFVFGDLVDEALDSIHTTDSKRFTAQFIEGASGSGKTRAGYELCQAVTEKLLADECIASVFTLRLQSDDVIALSRVITDPRDIGAARDWLAKLLIRNAVGSKNDLTDLKGKPPIETVFKALLNGNSQEKKPKGKK